MDLDRDAALLLVGQADGPEALAQVERIVACCENAGADLAVATDDPAEGALLLQARRLAGWVVMEQGPTVIEDVAVPRLALGAMLGEIETISAATGIPIATVGHAGDGNLHPMLRLPDLSAATRDRAMDAADGYAARRSRSAAASPESTASGTKRHMLGEQLDPAALDAPGCDQTRPRPARASATPGAGYEAKGTARAPDMPAVRRATRSPARNAVPRRSCRAGEIISDGPACTKWFAPRRRVRRGRPPHRTSRSRLRSRWRGVYACVGAATRDARQHERRRRAVSSRIRAVRICALEL